MAIVKIKNYLFAATIVFLKGLV